jgi:protein SCO1/2
MMIVRPAVQTGAQPLGVGGAVRSRGLARREVVLGLLAGAFGPTGAHAAEPANERAAFSVQTRRGVQPPDIALLSMTRRTSSLRKELDRAEPVVVNFVFTTCSTICSTQTATLAALQRQLRLAARPARFLSFTIDPDNDTPEQLARFAQQFGVGDGWEFFTGQFDDLLAQQRAFDVYRGAKAGHPPVVLMRGDRAGPWVRIEGHPSPLELQRVFDRLPKA